MGFFDNPMLDAYLPPLFAFFGVALIMPFAMRWARDLGLTDKPGGRKTHEDETPLIGGLVVFPVFMLVGIFAGMHFYSWWPLFVALSLILLAGALDDRFHINPWIKFGVQFIAAAIIVLLGDARLYSLGNLFGFGGMGLSFMSIPFSVVAVVLLVNAINLMDGLDGLAAGKSLVALSWLMIACASAGQWPPFFVIAILVGAILGFLMYNLRHPLRAKASVFLGDAGSMALGLALAWFSIGLAQNPDPVLVPITIAWILALPIMDACGQFFRRVKNGHHPFYPDRGHFHHHFVGAGIPDGGATALIMLWSFLLGGVGYIGVSVGVPQYVLTILWIALLFAHMAMSYKPAKFISVLEKIAQGRSANKKH